MSPAVRRFTWLGSENRRAWAAMIPTFVVMFVASTIANAIGPPPSATEVLWRSMLWGWTVYAVSHTLLTWWTFRRLTGADLLDAMTSHPQRSACRNGPRRFAVVRLFLGGNDSAPSWSVQVSLLALIGVAVLLLNTELRTPTLLISGGLLVAASWVNVWMMFAVQYARQDAVWQSLGFPGTETRAFTDYLYVALAGQATFGPGDVSPTTTAMRRTMMYQFVIAFIFNSVILAMVVSLLLNSGS